MKVLIFTVLAAALLTACGGGNRGAQQTGGGADATQAASSAPAITPPAQERINGILVPPDPGVAKDATVAGIDTDQNGIRDEVDRWIATRYGDKPGALEAIRMVANSDQKLMTSNPSTQAEALSVAYESMDVGGCTGGKLRSEGITASRVFNESMIRTYNTRARIDARKKVFSLAGMIVRDVEDTTIVCPYSR